ncbi:basic salivary proline-rich protein 2-like [Scylla paramamosain]|uniref:basic salivary proline-rich protein 2-like n=1 Tax=Scylla paramamosain TaxID=85552 RepID=UPI003082F8AB
MGGKSSRLSVEARLSLLGECGVDAVRLSRPRSGGCCGRGRRSLASFTFRQGAEGGKAPRVGSGGQPEYGQAGRLGPGDTHQGALPGRRRNSLLSGPAPEGPPGRTEQESGQPPQAPQEDQAVRVPEAGQEAGPAPEAGQVVVASPGHEAGHAPEAGQVVAASPGHEACPAPEAGQVVAASLGHEVGPSPEAGQVVAASPGKEAGPAPEAGQVVAASPGKDSLGLQRRPPWQPRASVRRCEQIRPRSDTQVSLLQPSQPEAHQDDATTTAKGGNEHCHQTCGPRDSRADRKFRQFAEQAA